MILILAFAGETIKKLLWVRGPTKRAMQILAMPFIGFVTRSSRREPYIISISMFFNFIIELVSLFSQAGDHDLT